MASKASTRIKKISPKLAAMPAIHITHAPWARTEPVLFLGSRVPEGRGLDRVLRKHDIRIHSMVDRHGQVGGASVMIGYQWQQATRSRRVSHDHRICAGTDFHGTLGREACSH